MVPLLVLLACTGPSPLVKGAPGDPDSGKPGVSDTAGPAPDSGDTATDADTAVAPVVPAPCAAWGAPRDVGILGDAERNEVSGVAPSTLNAGVFWILEDHGNAPAFYAIDLIGAPLGTLTLEGVENVDWEAIALGPCAPSSSSLGTCLWAADVGDNASVRAEVALYRVPEPEVGWGGGLDATVAAERFPLVYPDGAVNVEALVLLPDGRPVLLSKRGDGVSEVYVVDTLTPEVVATPRYVGRFGTRTEGIETGGYVTSADLWPDGSRLLVRTYDAAWELDLGDGGVEGILDAPRIPLPFTGERQVEAVAYDVVLGGYWQIPEAANAPMSFVPCLD